MDVGEDEPTTSRDDKQHNYPPTNSTATNGETDQVRTTRSSARVRAAKEKVVVEPTIASNNPLPGSSKSKGKSSEEQSTRSRKKQKTESTATTARGIVIREPRADPKGKKRAQPEPDSSDDQLPSPPKRLRSSSRLSVTKKSDKKMPRKPRSSLKGKAAAISKAKASSSVLEDVDMADDHYSSEGERDMDMADLVEPAINEKGGEEEDDEDGENEEGEGDGDEDDDEVVDDENPLNAAPTSADLEEARNLFGLLGGDLSHLGSLLSNISSRLKSMLTNIKQRDDPTVRVIALQELSELLSMSNEDTLQSFSTDAFVTELVKIMGGSGKVVDDDSEGEGTDEEPPKDPDAALAAALAGGDELMEDIPEAQLLACRCMANLIEAIPGSAHTIVYHGAIPVLCSKLIMITDIDLAEQTLSTLHKISEEYPSAIVREGGLAALLNMLDFFPTGVQRIAIHAAANCCRNISSDSFEMVRQVFPVIRGVLGSSDQRMVEYAALCVIRLIEAYHRSSPDNLTALLDADLIVAIRLLLLSGTSSPLLSANTYTLFLRALATAAKSSAKTALALLESNIVQILYQLLTGVLPPTDGDPSGEQGDASGGQGLGGGLADMAVMENLAHRPKDQVEEALSLTGELLPPLPKDGIFDNKLYTEKALARMAKAKAKADRAASRYQPQSTLEGNAETSSPCDETTPQPADTNATPAAAETETSDAANTSNGAAPPSTAKADPAGNRLELLQSKPLVVTRFIRLMVPVLVDVYAASVLTNVRIRALSGILKAVNFLEVDVLENILKTVPISSFCASILSSSDHYTLIVGALQLVEHLLSKAPSSYRPSFRREGVLHTIETIADRKLTTAKSKEKEKEKDKEMDMSPSAAVPELANDGATLPPPVMIPMPASPAKRSSSTPMDPQDLIILRGRVVRFRYLIGQAEVEEDTELQTLRRLCALIIDRGAKESALREALSQMAQVLLGSADNVSSFELKQIGLIDALLTVVTETDFEVDLTLRKKFFFDAFFKNGQSLPVLVKRFQEILTRSESFEVRTVSPGFEDGKHRNASMLARSMRLRLVADESSDVPKTVANMTVSIQAIATFQALNDYLRPRLTGVLPHGGSASQRLSAMLAMAESKAQALLGAGSSTMRFNITSPAVPTSSSANQAETSTAAASGSGIHITRRRSQRLSKKVSDELAPPASEKESVPPVIAPIPQPATGSDLPDDNSLIDPDVEAEVVDDDAEDELPEKTVNVSMTADGAKIEAKTPQGTRVATPNPMKEKATPSTPTPRGSYAAALKTKPTDWHLQFSIDDHAIPLDATIYGAFYQHELRKAIGSSIHPSSIWSGLYTVKFKKVEGPVPTAESKPNAPDAVVSDVTSIYLPALPEDDICTRIFRLLRILNTLNSEAIDHPEREVRDTALPQSALINNKLTAKLVRQLEETMIVASSCLPDWALDLPQRYPFLFPFSSRYSFLQSTSFGYARLILKWQSQQERNTEHSRRDDGFGYLGRLQRQKVRISRKHLLESAVKVFELYGSSSSVLEVEYFEEVGTGLGPTLEFYSLVSKEFARRDLKLWRDADSTLDGAFVFHPQGLFPAPASGSDSSESTMKRTQLFQVIGQFIAKALLDSRIIDISLNKMFLRLVHGERVSLTIDTLRLVDRTLADSLTKVLKCKEAADPVSALQELSLDFTLPGYDIELKPDGVNIPVTPTNVDEYIRETLDAFLGKGVEAQVQSFRSGFSKVFPMSDMRLFSADELSMLFGNGDEDWSLETIMEAVKADHGFTIDSQPIRYLLSIMSEYDAVARRQFLQFITGSPKLPIGGFRGLNPPFTVVRKPHEAPLLADDYLPSVMTCVNYLKLPEYSSREMMKGRLHLAAKEGIHSGFHLS